MAGPSGPRGIPEGMVYIPGGEFDRGTVRAGPDSKPVRRIHVDAFFMDATEVTNFQFSKFVDETGYLTIAEQKPDPKTFRVQTPSYLFRVQSSLHLPISKLKSGVPEATSNGGAGNPAPTGNIRKVPEVISKGWILIQ